MFSQPEIGKVVTVVIDWEDIFKDAEPSVRAVYSKTTTTGLVVANQKFQDPASFCIQTGHVNFPVANIPLDRVASLVYEDGEAVAEMAAVNQDVNETWLVPGSKGAEYTVTRNGDKWSCECVGFGFRATCKHVNAKKAEVLERSA